MSNLHQESKQFFSTYYNSHQPVPAGSRSFYDGRIRFILAQHDFGQREQLLGMVLSAAMGDRALSVSDMLYVVSQVEEAHKRSMEMNYNDE